MIKELIVSSTSLETKLAILEDDQVTEILIEREKNRGILGNIYKGKVTKVLPGMQAAFVDIGFERHAFLYVADFFEDYEEYEEIFSESKEIDRVTLGERPAETSPEEPAKRVRSRRKKAPKPDSREGSERRSPVLAEVHLSRSLDEAGALVRPRILPQHLDLTGLSKDSFARTDGPREAETWTGILPDHLDLDAGLEADRSAEKEHSRKDASLGQAPKLSRLAGRPSAKKAESGGRGKGKNRRKNGRGSNQPKAMIGDLLRVGQEILVQVAKEPMGKKGARITSYVALPGRHLVYMPTVDHIGVSRKIASEKERARLRDCVMKLRSPGAKGFIVRTAGEGQTEDALAADMAYLTREWEKVRTNAEKKKAPALVHAEPSLVQRVIRDRLTDEFRAIRVDDDDEYRRIVDFVNTLAPEMVPRIRLHRGRKHIFEAFGVSPEIEKALKHKVWLKNGGHIVINQTEALVAIDVNTGRFVGKTNSLEDTITKTNLDAVREVVRQIRLRDLGGIIVIDFIDMDEWKNRQKVMEALQSELAKDKSPSKILRFNEFGLVALTRKRVKQSLEKVLCQPCIFCSGTGITKSSRTVVYSIHQEVRRMTQNLGNLPELLIRCHPEVARTLVEREKEVLREIKEMTGKVVSVKPDPLKHIEQFDLVEA